jgi:signal recognition particle subunit SRP54
MSRRQSTRVRALARLALDWRDLRSQPMFESLSDRLSDAFKKLTGKGVLNEADVRQAMREVRLALLEADVALPVARQFIERATEKSIGSQVLKSVTPGQQVVKIVNDELVNMLAGDGPASLTGAELSLGTNPPSVVLMCGLQGSGKTTTTAKLAIRLRDRDKKRCLMASVDVHRPAAQQQLATLGLQANIDTLPVVFGELAPAIARRAIDTAKRQGYDVVFIDTAGRTTVDEMMMKEAEEVARIVNPNETLLVADAMTGQDAVGVAEAFGDRLGVTGIVLTRIDGDARGGAALSMRAVTGKPIRFMGTGEKLDAIEPFHADRIASRILGMGDIVSLVERAAETIEQEEAENLAKKLQAGKMDLSDLLSQLRQMKRMGGLGGLMGLLPQVGKLKQQMAEANINEKLLARQEAIILSMTPMERRKPELLKASRKRRIAAGSGVEVQEVNRLLKQFEQMRDMMKKMNKLGKKKGKKGLMPSLAPGMGLPGPGGVGEGGILPKIPGLTGKGNFNPFSR